MEHKQELRTYEERVTNLKQQLVRDRDKAIKKTNRDMTEVHIVTYHELLSVYQVLDKYKYIEDNMMN